MKLTTYEFIKLKEDRKRESKIVKRINRGETNKIEDESKVQQELGELKPDFTMLSQDSNRSVTVQPTPKPKLSVFDSVLIRFRTFVKGRQTKPIVSSSVEFSENAARKETTNDSGVNLVKSPLDLKQNECHLDGPTSNLVQTGANNQQMFAVLKLGTGGDDQSHVKRPRTASKESVTKLQNQL